MHNEYFYLPDKIQQTIRDEKDIFKYIELDKQRLASTVKIPSREHRREFLRAFGIFSFPLFDDILFKSAPNKNFQEDLNRIKNKMQKINSDFNKYRLKGPHLVFDLLRAEENRVAHNYAQKMEDHQTSEIYTRSIKKRKIVKITDNLIVNLHIKQQRPRNDISNCKIYLKIK